MSEFEDMLKRWDDMAIIYEQQIQVRDTLADIVAELPNIKAAIDAKNAELARLREAVTEVMALLGALNESFNEGPISELLIDAIEHGINNPHLAFESTIVPIRAWLDKYGKE